MRLIVLVVGLLSIPAFAMGQPLQDLVKHFEYDTSMPLDVRQLGVEQRDGVTVLDITYASPMGGRVPAYVVVPNSRGRSAAIIWGHWYWGNSAFRNRREFLDEAVALARSGVVSLLFDGPVARPGFYVDRTALNDKQITDRLQAIADARRAADLLLMRSDVDPARLAYVGHSYNASTGGYLAGIDKRFKAFVLMAGGLSDKVDLETDAYRKYRERVGPEKFNAFIARYAWLDPGLYVSHAAPAAVLMQFATKEDFLTVERARKYAELVSEPKEFKVYEGPHALNASARHDRVEFLRRQLRLRKVDWAAIDRVPELPQPPDTARVVRKTTTAPDGVQIVYSTAGTADTAIVFIHGGAADRSFYDAQFDALSDQYRVIAIDLAGHGESGTNRQTWGIPQFGADVKSVIDAEKLRRVVLFGNSLGGPVAIEAALLMPDRAIGVVGIDTFQDLGHPDTPEYARMVGQMIRQRAEAFRTDYAGSMKAMVKSLFHPDADPWLIAETQRRMMRTSPEAAQGMFLGMVDYDANASARKLAAPLRAINGDLYPTDVERVRKVKPDFNVVVMKHMGHYPMLERPEEFSTLVRTIAGDLAKVSK